MAKQTGFDAYLLPDEEILWSANSQTNPLTWKEAGWRLVAGIVLLGLFAPEAYSLIVLCIKAGNLFPAEFIGAFESAKRLGLAGLGIWLIWWGGRLLLRQKRYSFALSAQRVFGAPLWRGDKLITASFVDPRGSLAITSLGGLFEISVPIQHAGDGEVFVLLSHLSASDHEAAIAELNRIFVRQSP